MDVLSRILSEGLPEEWPDGDRYNFYHIGALTSSQRGDFTSANRFLKAASDLPRCLRREYFRHLEISGFVHILAGEHSEAEQFLREGEKLAFEIAPDSTLISQIKRLFGDLYVATGKFDLAYQYASEGLAVAEKINERLEIAACWRVFAQVETHRGHADLAREWYGKAIDLFNLIPARYELASTRYLAATSGLYGPAERTAMLYMAKEYFESEAVTSYVEKITVELNKTERHKPLPTARSSADGAPAKIITGNPAMLKILDLADHVAASEMTVLLTGDTGTGKDLLARYIHERSGRTGEFVTVNTAALPLTMIESELFGFRKGAFTGADRDRPGLIEQAHNGTLYLNELADAPPELQVKLLEVIETRSVRRLGENTSRKVNFRLIAASNQDLRQCVNDRRFRADLFHRLNEIPIELPPLDARRDDIPALVAHFLVEFGYDNIGNGDSEALDRLASILTTLQWPGNVRQLQMTVKNLWVTSGRSVVAMSRLALDLPVGEDHNDEFASALTESGGNKSEAARRLGMSESTFRYRLRRK
ncbi:MAG TPA: sigma 54-interacting transcriptional regulator [Candidatus Acidoferrum sp.]|nr:sigma 54-interacting transcriptional regulator [Candidatus Acidoferrum sp.]